MGCISLRERTLIDAAVEEAFQADIGLEEGKLDAGRAAVDGQNAREEAVMGQ